MKAVLLAGGKGSRLRPLTLHTPKPIVPIFDLPFLRYQIDLLRQVPEIDEIVLSLNYQPHRIEEVFGDGFTSVDLPSIIQLHRDRRAKATIVLTPVDNPTAYGLVETDADGNVID